MRATQTNLLIFVKGGGGGGGGGGGKFIWLKDIGLFDINSYYRNGLQIAWAPTLHFQPSDKVYNFYRQLFKHFT